MTLCHLLARPDSRISPWWGRFTDLCTVLLLSSLPLASLIFEIEPVHGSSKDVASEIGAQHPVHFVSDHCRSALMELVSVMCLFISISSFARTCHGHNSEGRKWEMVRPVVVEFGVFWAPRFSVQRCPNTNFLKSFGTSGRKIGAPQKRQIQP